MKHFFYLLFNIIIAAILLSIFYDPSQDYELAVSAVSCMDDPGKSKIFCAQCIKRDDQIMPNKVFNVSADQNTNILKIKTNNSGLTCFDYLQFPDYQSTKPSNAHLTLENAQAIQEIVQEVGGVLAVATGAEIITSEYNQFVIYRWFELTQTRQSPVKIPNLRQIYEARSLFLFAVNGVIMVFIILFLYNRTIFSHLKSKILITASFYFVLLEALTLNLLNGDVMLQYARIFFLTLLLMRIDTNKIMIALSLALGIIAKYQPRLYIIYLLFVMVLLFSRGYNQQNTRQIWTYLILSMIIYSSNQIWWDYKYAQWADNHCRIIELACLIFTPLGLILIKDARYVGFDIYPAEQKKHSISLNGFEEEEDEEETGI